MRIQVLVNCLTRFGQYRQGEVDLPETEAAELVDHGWAVPSGASAVEPVSTETEAEAPAELESEALGEAPETAAEKKPGRKRAGR